MRLGFLDSACPVRMLPFPVTVSIIPGPPETDQQADNHNIFSSQQGYAGLGIMFRLHTAELCVYRRIMPLRSVPGSHRLLSLPVEVGSQDVLRLRVRESSFFFIILPPLCIFKGFIPILEEAFT